MKISLTNFRGAVLVLLLFLAAIKTSAQSGGTYKINSNNAGNETQYDRNGRVLPTSARNNGDSLKHRDNTEDSITIFFRYFDSTSIKRLDSSILDLSRRLPLPADYYNIGNMGAAARSFIFSPNLKAGPDAGFHSFDVYRFKLEETRFFQTTRPYTELGYLLGSKSEQIVNILHTQNIKPNFNMALQYRFINSPGEFRSQNASHNNYRINGNYQGTNKRYTAYGILVRNKIRSSENGGLREDSSLNKTGLNDPFNIPTRLTGQANFTRNFFNTSVNTGNLYDETNFLFRHQYDLGQKDSIIVNDSTTIRLFYPRIRLQHTFKYSTNTYQFRDLFSDSSVFKDYKTYFGYAPLNDSTLFRDQWKDITNDFSIVSFPEKNNLNQFLKVGASLQNLQGIFKNASHNYYNVILGGEYRNRTRNQKWNLEATGQFYAAGRNLGDYALQASLKKFVSKKLGSIELGFQNVNRKPSSIFTGETSFPVKLQGNFGKENTSRIFARITNPDNHLNLFGEYYLLSNYSYFDSFFTARQEGTLFNVLHVAAEKRFTLKKGIYLYSEIHLQQTAGNPPLNLPLIYTRNRLVYEANLYKNLFLATGLEFRYHTFFKADNYSPFVGQFFNQENFTLRNRPDVNAFFNFRIKSFTAYVRLENLNTLRNNGGIGFTGHNFSAAHYPSQGFWFRLGIWWSFVN